MSGEDLGGLEMTAEEIRKEEIGRWPSIVGVIWWLREIAAQLAEMNERQSK